MEGGPGQADGAGGEAVRAVLLDAGNTLVFIDPHGVTEALRQVGVDADVDGFWRAERVARSVLVKRFREGSRRPEARIWREYFATLYRAAGVSADLAPGVTERIKALHEANRLWAHVPDGVAPALQALLDAGYRLAVISNADGRVERILEREGLTPYMEFVLDSTVVGVEKPDPVIFHMALERLGLGAGECLYVGDLYDVDIVGARGAGLRAVLVDPYDLSADRDVDRIPSVAELPAYVAALGGGGWAVGESPGA